MMDMDKTIVFPHQSKPRALMGDHNCVVGSASDNHQAVGSTFYYVGSTFYYYVGSTFYYVVLLCWVTYTVHRAARGCEMVCTVLVGFQVIVIQSVPCPDCCPPMSSTSFGVLSFLKTCYVLQSMRHHLTVTCFQGSPSVPKSFCICQTLSCGWALAPASLWARSYILDEPYAAHMLHDQDGICLGCVCTPHEPTACVHGFLVHVPWSWSVHDQKSKCSGTH
jgi:hypothetical protein